jgi:hypothetical protein
MDDSFLLSELREIYNDALLARENRVASPSLTALAFFSTLLPFREGAGG